METHEVHLAMKVSSIEECFQDWDARAVPKKKNGLLVRMNDVLLLCFAFSNVNYKSEFTDLRDVVYPYRNWPMYSVPTRQPIVCFGFSATVRALWGLHWFAFGTDALYSRGRASEEFKARFKTVLRAVSVRALFFLSDAPKPMSIMNKHEEYTEDEEEAMRRNGEGEVEVEDEDESGYCSDEERLREHRKKRKLAQSAAQQPPPPSAADAWDDWVRQFKHEDGGGGKEEEEEDKEEEEEAAGVTDAYQTLYKAQAVCSCYIFDVNWVLFELYHHLHELEWVLEHTIEADERRFVCGAHARRHFERAFARQTNMEHLRVEWHMKRVCSRAMIMHYKRAMHRDGDVAVAHVMGRKLGNLVRTHIPSTVQEMVHEPADQDIDATQWIRTNTDFLFETYAALKLTEGDVCAFVTHRHRWIRYIALANVWVLQYRDFPVTRHTCLLYAFVQLRKYQIAARVPPVFVEEDHCKCDLAQLDWLLGVT